MNFIFGQSYHFPTMCFEPMIFFGVFLLLFVGTMPVCAITFNGNPPFWYRNIHQPNCNLMFFPVANPASVKFFVNGTFNAGCSNMLTHLLGYVRTLTLPRAKAKFMQFCRFHPLCFSTPLALTFYLCPQWMCCASHSSFSLVIARIGAVPCSVFTVWWNLKNFATYFAGYLNRCLFVGWTHTNTSQAEFAPILLTSFRTFHSGKSVLRSTGAATKLAASVIDSILIGLEFFAAILTTYSKLGVLGYAGHHSLSRIGNLVSMVWAAWHEKPSVRVAFPSPSLLYPILRENF